MSNAAHKLADDVEYKAKSELTFEVNKAGTKNAVKEPFYFRADNAGQPEKVGDGTYGVVFGVENAAAEQYVVKIFYETLTTPRLRSLKFSEDNIKVLDRLFQGNEKPADENADRNVVDNLRKLMGVQNDTPFQSLGDLVAALIDHGVSGEHLKLTLDYFQSNSTPLEQFHKERDASVAMRNALQGQDVLGVVNIEASTEEFKKSQAYKLLEPAFKAMLVDVSNYALVMKRYRFSLKDILEGPTAHYSNTADKALLSSDDAPDKELRQVEAEEDNSEIDHTSGYAVLRSLSYDERIRTILPFLKQVAQGIRTLHAAKQYHFDLKPANIFVNNRAGTPDVVIGDLGSIQQRNVNVSTASMHASFDAQDLLLLGTRHYRSAEQKDFFDICNVRVFHNEAHRVVLEVTDRKFHDTIIEKGDIVVFSKNSDASVRYEIDAIECVDGASETRHIVLADAEPAAIKPDDKTQVILYKKQSARTDLFGLGALAYDLITCGWSPERFYDGIRYLDDDKMTKGEGADSILRQYERLTLAHASTDPALRSLFEPFVQNRGEEVRKEYVAIILRCMLYRASGTYFNPDGRLDEAKNRESQGGYSYAIEAAIEAIDKLSRELKADPRNRLLEPEKIVPAQLQIRYLGSEVQKLQGLTSAVEMPARLARGVVQFSKIFEQVTKEFGGLTKSTNLEPFKFAEMIPDNISCGETYGFREYTYQSLAEYRKDLRADEVFSKINHDPLDPYVPYHFVALRRRIRIWLSPESSGKTFQYRFLDSSPAGAKLVHDDWIVDLGGASGKKLWRVVGINNDDNSHRKFALVDEQGGSPTADAVDLLSGSRLICYQNLDPARYYLNMLGIYLHQIFFANLGKTSLSTPEVIEIARRSIEEKGNKHIAAVYRLGEFERSFAGISALITQTYVRLIMYGSLESPSPENAKKCFEAAQSEQETLRWLIARYLHKAHPSELESVQQDERMAVQDVSDEMLRCFNFNELIRKNLRKKGFFGSGSV